ncbi:MAG: hypothetical protein ACR2M3_20835 [Thermomicrobiales bacterium]
MNPGEVVLLITLAASCYSVGTIWMVQVSWRLFAYVGPAEFPDYHRAWWLGPRGIQPIVFPLAGLAFLGSVAEFRWRPSHASVAAVWLSLTLQVLAYVLTAAWWGRWQAQLHRVRLDDGSLNPLYQRLLSTHWLRVALLTAAAAPQFWMAVRSLRYA